MIIFPKENLHPYHSSLIEMEEKRKKARQEQERKYKEANDKLNQAFYRHQPTYCQHTHITSPTSAVALETMNTFINEVHNPFFQTIIEEEYKKSHCNVPSYSTSTSNNTDYSSSYSDSSSSSCDSSSSSSSSSYD